MITTEKQLPNGWRWAKLSTLIANAQSGFACGLRDPADVIQLRMNNLDTRGNFIWDDYIRVPAEKETIEQYKLLEEDVVFNNTNSTELVGKSALFTGFSEPVVYSNHFTRLRPKSEALLPAFLSSWLNQQWQQGVFADICNRWIGQSAVKPSKLLSLDFPLPPLSEQKRIVKILNEQMAAVEKARKAVCDYFNTTNILSSAYLRNIFSQDNLKRWPKKQFGDIAQITAKQVNPTLPEYCDLPHVNGENIESGTGRLTYLNTAAEELMISGKYLFSKGSVLYSKLRPYLRKVALIDFDGVCSADMYPIQVDSNYLRPDFTAWLLLSDEFTNYAVSESQRARMPKLNRKQLFSWEAPLPTLDEQEEMINKLLLQMEKTTILNQKVKELTNTIDALPSAFLRKAFRGEI